MTLAFSAAPLLATDRLALGPASPAHAEAFMTFGASDDARFIGGPAPAEDCWDSVAEHAGQWVLRGYGTFWVSEAATGTPVGRVGIYHPFWRDEPELSWVIYPDFQGRGYATEAAQAARDWACDKAGLRALMSLIDTANAASEAVARHLGAAVEATHSEADGRTILRWRHPGPEARA